MADECPFCGGPTYGNICPKDGYVGPAKAVTAGGEVPLGGIIMWSGASAAVPSGWHLCDGSGGTPDLRDRFIVGAGSSYAVAATGGSNAAHAHGVSIGVSGSASGSTCNPAGVDEHTLSGLTGMGGNHNHATSGTSGTPSATNNLTTGGGNTYATGGHTHSLAGTTDYPGSHQHDPSGISVSSHGTHIHTLNSGTISGTASGTSDAGGGMPAYYALALIMRTN